MGFSAKQLHALRRNVEERHIRIRESNGRQLTYIEGWYAIAQANRIFGFDGWSRETVDSKCVLARENRGAFLAVYTAKVRVTVYPTGSIPIVREGHGTAEGRGGTPGEVHDIALKAAETDATKRALATFGRPFGLELYRGQRADRHGKAQTRVMAAGPPIVPSQEPPSSNERLAREQSAASSAIQFSVPAGERHEPAAIQSSKARAADQGPAERDVDGIGCRSDSRGAIALQSNAHSAQTPRADHPGAPDTPHSAAADRSIQTGDAASAPPAKAMAHNGGKPDSAPSPSLPPDDTTPIARPSRHYGRRDYLASRERTGTLMQELARRAEASLALPPADPTPQKIDKSVLTFGEPKRLRDKAHLRFVASQPCLICGRQPADAHHLRFAQPRALGRKVSDEYTVPLCRGHHRQVHQTGNEQGFWDNLKINALDSARTLWEQTRNVPNDSNSLRAP